MSLKIDVEEVSGTSEKRYRLTAVGSSEEILAVMDQMKKGASDIRRASEATEKKNSSFEITVNLNELENHH